MHVIVIVATQPMPCFYPVISVSTACSVYLTQSLSLRKLFEDESGQRNSFRKGLQGRCIRMVGLLQPHGIAKTQHRHNTRHRHSPNKRNKVMRFKTKGVLVWVWPEYVTQLAFPDNHHGNISWSLLVFYTGLCTLQLMHWSVAHTHTHTHTHRLVHHLKTFYV